MIVYLDTSALVKLYAQEPHAEDVRNATVAARVCATHDISYVEARSAFARKRREGYWSESAYRGTVAALDDDWTALLRVAITPTLVRRASDFTERFALRAYDAIQLASAEAVAEQAGREFEVYFCCFDERLTVAGEQLGLRAHDEIRGY